MSQLESLTVVRVYRDRWPRSEDDGWLWLEFLHMPTHLGIAVMSNTRVALGFSDVMKMLSRAVVLSRGKE